MGILYIVFEIDGEIIPHHAENCSSYAEASKLFLKDMMEEEQKMVKDDDEYVEDYFPNGLTPKAIKEHFTSTKTPDDDGFNFTYNAPRNSGQYLGHFQE